MKSLIGKTFMIKGCTPSDGRLAIVAAADDNIGFTVVREDEPEHYIICTHGPGSSRFSDRSGHAYEIWEHRKEELRQAVQDGVFDFDSIGLRAGGAGPSACAF